MGPIPNKGEHKNPIQFTPATAVARELKLMLNAGSSSEDIRSALWSDACVYHDAFGGVFSGKDEIAQQTERTTRQWEVLSRTYSEPIATQERFIMYIGSKLKNIDTGEIESRYELGIFDVEDGKVVREEYVLAPESD